MKIVNHFLILLIKLYKYFIDCLKFHGPIKGFALGIKRIFRCHPIKILGGDSGFDPVPNPKKGEK